MITLVSSYTQIGKDTPIPLKKNALDEQWKLVEQYYDLKLIDCSKTTPLIFAIRANDSSLLNKLIELNVDLEEKNEEGITPLVTAIVHANELLLLLLNAGASVKNTALSLPPLHWAILIKNVQACEMLLENGVDLDLTDEGPLSPLLFDQFKEKMPLDDDIFQNGLKMRPLSFACLFDFLEIVPLLLSKGSKVFVRDDFGGAPFDFALMKNDENLCTLLCENGIDKDEKDLYFDIHHPLVIQNEATIRLLVKLGADVNKENEKGDSPLYQAIMLEKSEIIRLLIELGADVNKENKKGNPPLHQAIMLKKSKMIRLLIKLGADVNKKNKDGATPLHLAASINPKAIQLLLNNGARVNVVDADGMTPYLKLFLLNVESFHREKAQFFYKYADMLAKDKAFTSNLLQIRLLGHRFSLSEEIYQSLGPQVTYPALAKKIDQYICRDLSRNFHLFYTSTALRVAVDRSNTASKYANRLREGKIVVLETGWLNHVTSIVLDGELLAKCNRGNRNQLESGIGFYKIHSFEFLETVIDFLLNAVKIKYEEQVARKDEFMHFFEEKIDQLLELKLEYFMELPTQTTGNCGWLAAKMSLKAMLILKKQQAGISWKESASLINPTYKKITFFDRQQSLNEVQKIEAEFKEIIPLNDLYRKVVFSCVKRGNEPMLQSIIDTHSHLINAQNIKKTLLHKAIWKGNPETVSYLLEKGADHSLKDCIGNSPLHLSICCDHQAPLKIAEHLLVHHANIEENDRNGNTPLMLAAKQRNRELVKLFLTFDANVNAMNAEKWTPLHFACNGGDMKICKMLMKHGADLTAKLDDGSTPLDLAISKNYEWIIELFGKGIGKEMNYPAVLAEENATYSDSVVKEFPIHEVNQSDHSDFKEVESSEGTAVNYPRCLIL